MTLIRRLVDDLDVRTEIELEIVQALASCLWRVRRLARAEVFEISRLVEDQAQYSAIMAGGDEDDDVKPESRDVDAVMAKHIAGYKNEVFEGARDRLFRRLERSLGALNAARQLRPTKQFVSE